jgi:DUF4097 and DUF4098 domain-containing protein YvlB
MPSFDTPQPISVTVDFGVGDLRVTATDRTHTVVEVRPTDATKKSDVAAAEQTQVEYANGALLVKAPKGRGWRYIGPRKGSESVDIVIEVPAGSQLLGSAGIGGLRTTGRLGECRFNTGVGDIQIDDASAADLRTGVGDIAVDRTAGHADIKTGSGAVRIGTIDGSAVIRNSNGDTWVGDVRDDVRVNAANGRIGIDHAGATVTAKTANGDIRLGDVARGAVIAHTALGKIDIGIATGVAAWLDLNTSFGAVVNGLDAASQPEPGADTVEIRARTSFGDITIHRAAARDAVSSVV